jgi:hypothetical protein
MKLKRYFIDETNFYFSFFEKQHIPSVCENILFNNNALTGTKKSNENKLSSKITVLNLFPNYLNLELNKGLYCKKSIHKPGLAVDLSKGFNSVDDYLKQGSSSFRKVVTRSVNRLESCFNIEYKMFYGSIEKSECDLLMDKLYTMIENRFKQRSGRNTILRFWDYYRDLAYNGINNKTASLFAIYSDGLPIEVSLNFHYDDLMFSYASSYDLNYSKFSLGNIDIYKQLEWCLDNKIALFDIGYGDYEYKRKWVNLIYDFETYYLTTKKTVFFQLFAYLHHSKAKLIHYLILKKVNYWFHDTVDKIKGIDKTYVPDSYEIYDSKGQQHENNNIDINAKDFFYLRKPVYDHAYTSQEHINDLKVYKSLSDSNAYVIKGKKSEIGFKFNKQINV